MAHEKKCIVCGTQYKYCNHCSEYNSEETWRHLFCSENCKGIFDIYMKTRDGVISKEEAIRKIKKFDLSNIENFSNQVKPAIKSLLEEEVKEEVKEELANLEVEVDDTVSVDEEKKEFKHVKPFYNKNKNKKNVNEIN